MKTTLLSNLSWPALRTAVKSSKVVTLFGSDYDPTAWLDPYLKEKKEMLKALQKEELKVKQAQIDLLKSQIELLNKRLEDD